MRSIASIAGDARPRTTPESHAAAQPSKQTTQATDAAVADATQAAAARSRSPEKAGDKNRQDDERRACGRKRLRREVDVR